MRVRLRYLVVIGRRDIFERRRAYYRRAGRMVPIAAPDGRRLLPTDPGFVEAYSDVARTFIATDASTRPEAPHSVAPLVANYLKSETFRDEADSTQVQYHRVMTEIAEKIGSKSVKYMELPHVLALRDAFGGKSTPCKANTAVALLSILMEHTRSLGWRKDNPALRPKKLTTGPGYPSWSGAEVRTLLDHPAVGEAIKRATVLAYYTGARVSDLIVIPRTARRAGVICFTPSKTESTTGATVEVPEHPELTAILNAAPPSISRTLLTRHDGSSWPIDYTKKAIAKAVKKAGLRDGLSFLGLRKGLTSSLAEHGATDAAIDVSSRTRIRLWPVTTTRVPRNVCWPPPAWPSWFGSSAGPSRRKRQPAED